jgi:hypothetical protein
MLRLLTVVALILSLSCFSQIHSEKLDSLSRVIASKNQSVKTWQDSFKRRQDSIYRHNTGNTGSANGESSAPDSGKGQGRRLVLMLIGLIVLPGLVLLALFKRINRKNN